MLIFIYKKTCCKQAFLKIVDCDLSYTYYAPSNTYTYIHLIYLRVTIIEYWKISRVSLYSAELFKVNNYMLRSTKTRRLKQSTVLFLSKNHYRKNEFDNFFKCLHRPCSQTALLIDTHNKYIFKTRFNV